MSQPESRDLATSDVRPSRRKMAEIIEESDDDSAAAAEHESRANDCDQVVFEDENRLAHYEDRRLRSLMSDSRNVSALAGISTVLFLLTSILTLFSISKWSLSGEARVQAVIFGAVAVVYLFSALAIRKRDGRARVVAICASGLALMGFPIGTIIGIIGLVATIRSPELFGDAPIRTREVKEEIKARRKAKKLAKKRVAAFE